MGTPVITFKVIRMRGHGREEVGRLVASFQARLDEYISQDYPEAQLRVDYLNKFLAAFGWDVFNEQGKPQSLREVVVEHTVDSDDESDTSQKRPDYTLCLEGERKFFFEAKKPSVNIDTAREPAIQVRGYGWSAQMPISVLSNFKKLKIYDCREPPKEDQHPNYGLLWEYDYTEYVEKYDEIYDLISREAVYSGSFEENIPTVEAVIGEKLFDEYFLGQIEKWRYLFAADLHANNPDLDQKELNFIVPRILHRIIFLRICEDRKFETYRKLQHISSYNELKAIFLEADRKYNSSLFDFLEDTLSPNVKIGEDVFINIFKELYMPASPYNFSVVDAGILGQIYEKFLSKEIVLDEEHGICILEKPESVESNGVVPTPKYIVERIVRECLDPLCQEKSPEQLQNMHLADIACGSGSFLVSAYEYLMNHHLEWYISQGAENYPMQVSGDPLTGYRLTIEEKNRILLNYIFGIDLDQQAVEVTKFSLLLKALENVSAPLIHHYLTTHREGVLPDLSDNVKRGNSLVDARYLEFDESILTDTEKFERISPFNWQEEFPIVFENGGFDALIGNPPYIRIQNMMRYSLDETRYYQSTISPYITARTNNVDKYYLFLERGLELLNSTGVMTYIVPHKFFKIKAGKGLRRLLSSENHVSKIIHFGVEQVFPPKTTYTCIIKIKKSGVSQFKVEFVGNLNAWKRSNDARVCQYNSTRLGEEPWIFMHPRLEDLYERIKMENPTKLKDVADAYVGVQTSRDNIYIINPIDQDGQYVYFNDRNHVQQRIEKAILRPCINDEEISAFSRIKPNRNLIFPYRIENGCAIPYSAEEMEAIFPECWRYLNLFKADLVKRSIQLPRNRSKSDWWHVYGRTQSLTEFDGRPKLIWPTLSTEPRYAIDMVEEPSKDIIFTGGGNGPYYALKPKEGVQMSIFYIQSILCHPVIEAINRAKGSDFRGNYTSHAKQYIEETPIRTIDFANPDEVEAHNSIALLTQRLISLNDEIMRTQIQSEIDLRKRQFEMTRSRIEGIINRLYQFDSSDLETATLQGPC